MAEEMTNKEQLNSETSVFDEMSDEVKKSLFVQEEQEQDQINPKFAEVPSPEYEVEEQEEEKINVQSDFTSEDIVNLIESVDEDGHSPSIISVSLEHLVDLKEGMTVDDLTSKNRQYVDGMKIEYAAVSFDMIDEDIMTCTLTFDTPNDAYLIELNDLLNRYKIMQKEYAMNADVNAPVPFFALSFAPQILMGFGVMQLVMPAFFTRCLNDAGTNASMLLAFHTRDMSFGKVEMSEDDYAQLQADVYRDMESSTGGMLFED